MSRSSTEIGSCFTTLPQHKFSKWQMQPTSNTSGWTALILDKTELLVPFITLQLSLVKATTFVLDVSNFLQCREYLIEYYRKKIEKIKTMNINHEHQLFFLSHYLKVPSRTSQMASPVPTLHTGMSRKRVIAQCCISKYLTSTTRHLSHP